MITLPSSAGHWGLAAGVHAIDIDGDLVLLDVRSDAYYCLPGVLAHGELALDGRLIVGVPAAAEDLAAAALIEAGDRCDAPAPPPRPPTPCATALRTTYPQPPASAIPEAVRATLDMVVHYRGRRFANILTAVGPRDPYRAAPPSERLIEAVDRFHHWVPFAPVSGKCLLRSFMLLRHLRRQGLDALWVFGVRTWPFHAHCWLQCDGLVLDDHPDRVRAYAPILVV